MAALRLKEAVWSCDQGRAALLRLPVPLISTAVVLSKPCVPPPLGPRPTETQCSPSSPPSSPPPPPHYRQTPQTSCISSHQNCVNFPSLNFSMKRYQKTSHVSLTLPSDTPSKFPWVGASNFLNVERKDNNYDLPLFAAKPADSATDCRSSQASLNLLVKKLYSLDESEWLSSEAIVLQQPDRVERAAESPMRSEQEQRDHPRAERQLQTSNEKEKNQPPSDKASPAQMSFVLLKLREELPDFFDGHHSYHIYDAHVTFENNLSSFSWSSHNRQSYRMFLESSRLALKSSFSQVELDLIKITKDVDQGKIEARWRVRGRPRYLLSLRERVLIEGFSTFLVNSSGLISLHKMDRVMPAALKEKERNPWLVWLGSLVGVATRKSPLPQPELVNSSKYF